MPAKLASPAAIAAGSAPKSRATAAAASAFCTLWRPGSGSRTAIGEVPSAKRSVKALPPAAARTAAAVTSAGAAKP